MSSTLGRPLSYSVNSWKSVSSEVMKDLTNNLADACIKVMAEIQRLLSSQPCPIVVVLDGGSGAGKSTLASMIENGLDWP